MSTPSSSSHDPFQQFLASAYAVLQSGMDTQSLSVLLELQKSLATCPLDSSQAMSLIAERAQHVANASGVAIALLTGDQLVYRAGSGCAASFIGHRMTAVLSVSGPDQPRTEILRVEDAQIDGRIVADVCRQFEAQALLILPIYQGHVMAGVLQVLFREAHTFEKSELRAYRMIAEMIDDQVYGKPRLKPQPSTVLHAIEQITSHIADDAPAPAQVISYPVIAERWMPLPKLYMNTAVTGVITALVVAAGLIIYEHHHASPADASARQESSLPTPSTAQGPQMMAIPPKPEPSDKPSRGRTTANRTAQTDAPNSAFRRVWVGPNEVDYVADDVTIRRFTNTKPARPQLTDAYREVQFGKDVTVRYFAARPTVAPPPHPVSNAVQSVERAAPIAK